MDVYNYTSSGVRKGKIESTNPTWADLIDPSDDDLQKLSKELDIPIFVLERCREDFRPRLDSLLRNPEQYSLLRCHHTRMDGTALPPSTLVLFALY